MDESSQISTTPILTKGLFAAEELENEEEETIRNVPKKEWQETMTEYNETLVRA